MKTAIGAAALLLCLSGCALLQPAPAMTITEAENECAVQRGSAHFGSCVRYTIDREDPRWRTARDADLLDVYFAWLDAADARVAAGTMSDADMRLAEATLRSRILEVSGQRTYASQQASMNQVFAGLAIMNAGRQAEGPLISCTSSQLGQFTQTTCY